MSPSALPCCSGHFSLSRSRLLVAANGDIVYFPFGPWLAGYRTGRVSTFVLIENVRILLELCWLAASIWIVIRHQPENLYAWLGGAALLLVLARPAQILLTGSTRIAGTYWSLLRDRSNDGGGSYWQYLFVYGRTYFPVSVEIAVALLCLLPAASGIACLFGYACSDAAGSTQIGWYVLVTAIAGFLLVRLLQPPRHLSAAS